MPIHLIKLCVGCDTVEDLLSWRRGRPESEWRLRTRQTPKRQEDLLQGGSVYRVFKGVILCRQKILTITTVEETGLRRCEMILDADVVRVAPTPRRPFQGWRYLEAEDAPPDVGAADADGYVPPELALQLRELGAW